MIDNKYYIIPKKIPNLEKDLGFFILNQQNTSLTFNSTKIQIEHLLP